MLKQLSKKSASKQASKIQSRTLNMRKQLWPDLDENKLWNRNTAKGFTTIPRTMPHIFEIIDALGGKGTPLSRVYFSLWCRVFDESLIEVKSYADLAYEAGFSGQRAVTLWKQRMALLINHGFILAEAGTGGKFDYILLLNPYNVIQEHYTKGLISKPMYMALFTRSQEVGATELNQ